MRKRFFVCHILVILSGVVVQWEYDACAARDRVTLATCNVNYQLGLEKVAADYMALHPEVEVKLIFVAQDYATWIRTQFAGGEEMAPDLYNANFTNGFAEQGRWVQLDAYLQEVNPYTGRIWQEDLDVYLINRIRNAGKAYIIPLDFIEIGIFYNQDFFNRHGFVPPQSWEEMMELCEKIKATGMNPFAVGGNLDSFWSGTCSWIFRMLSDAYCRDLIPQYLALPGDWNYEPERNENWVQNVSDPYDDTMVVLSLERKYKDILEGRLRMDTPRFRRIYERFLEFTQYWQPGFMGMDDGSAHRVFINQKAAMEIGTTSLVTSLIKEMEDLGEKERFNWRVFAIPNIQSDPACKGTLRGVGGPGAMFAITKKKNLEHQKNVVDFLQYLASPTSMQTIVNVTLAEKRPLIGPPVIKNVKMPPHLEDVFEPFRGRGYEKLVFTSLDDEQESAFEWVAHVHELAAGRITLDTFLERYQKLMVEAVPRMADRLKLDLDPSTNDQLRFGAAGFIAPRKEITWTNGTVVVGGLLFLFGISALWGVQRTPPGKKKNQTRTAYMLLAPTFLLIIMFSYYPALSGLYSAFTRWEEGEPQVFNGLANFRKMLEDPFVRAGISNQLIFTITGVMKATIVPFLVAEMILSLRSKRMQYLFRTSFLVPMVVPGMVGILIWQFVYDPQMGILNNFLSAMGLSGLQSAWLGEPHLALWSLVFMGFPWVGAFGLLIYLVGLMNIPQEVMDASRLDCQSILQRIWNVDIPMVRGQTRLIVILTLIGSLQEFQSILILTNGGPGTSTMVPALRMYHGAFRFLHFGYGAAIGFTLFVVILVLTILNLRYLKPAEEA